jgi:hypothetical protein
MYIHEATRALSQRPATRASLPLLKLRFQRVMEGEVSRSTTVLNVVRYFQVLQDPTGSYRVQPYEITETSRNPLINKAAT